MEVPGMPGYEADMVLRSITYDSVKMQTGVTTFPLFVDDDDEDGRRYNYEHETKVIEWLLATHLDGNMRLTREELLIGNEYKFYAEVRKPVICYSGLPGDIDLLAIDKKNPHKSIALQVKRVKARVTSEDTAEMHDGTIEKGVKQAREMYEKYRFHRNYLMIVLVADTMLRKHDCPIFRNLSFEEKKPLYFSLYYQGLPEEVGLYIYEISQPSRNAIENGGTLGVREHRKAKRVDQECRTTESIIEFLKEKDKK